jgi:drug/metabolite transporter (DMT)-like permease
MQTRITFILFLAVGIISTASILIKLADAPAIMIAAIRLGIAGLILTPTAFVLRRNQLRSLSKRDFGLALASGAFLSLHFLTWITSLQMTSVASSVVLVATNPIFVGLGAVLIFKERLHPMLIAGISVSIVGILIIGADDLAIGPEVIIGDLLAIAGAITHSGYLLIGQRLRQKTDLLTYITIVYGMAAVILLTMAVFSGMSFVGYSPFTYLMILLLALGPQLIGHTSYNWSLKYVTAAVVSVVILAEPIGASFLAYIILDESLTPLKMVGGVLVLVGIYLAIRSTNRNRNSEL